jgi:hypothetical protein
LILSPVLYTSKHCFFRFIKKAMYLVHIVDHIDHFFNKSKKTIFAYI